jgi:hypothetical protein
MSRPVTEATSTPVTVHSSERVSICLRPASANLFCFQSYVISFGLHIKGGSHRFTGYYQLDECNALDLLFSHIFHAHYERVVGGGGCCTMYHDL